MRDPTNMVKWLRVSRSGKTHGGCSHASEAQARGSSFVGTRLIHTSLIQSDSKVTSHPDKFKIRLRIEAYTDMATFLIWVFPWSTGRVKRSRQLQKQGILAQRAYRSHVLYVP